MKSIEQITEEQRGDEWRILQDRIRKDDLRIAWICLFQAYFFIGLGFIAPMMLLAAGLELGVAIQAYQQSKKPL